MRTEDNILDLLMAESLKAEQKTKRALIIQPGAIGDCILTLPLAAFIKASLQLGGLDMLGHTEYIGFFPGRTCIDSVSSIDSVDLHRLFADPNDFILPDRDPLIKTFSAYSWIVTFMGEPESNFEKNLIFTTNCSNNSEVITLSQEPSKKFPEHISQYLIRQFLNQYTPSFDSSVPTDKDCHIKATQTDIFQGKELLWEFGLEPQKKLVVIQPGSGSLDKCWHFENYLSIIHELRSQNIQAVFLLGPAEMERFSKETIQLFTKETKCLAELPLNDVLKIMTCTDVFIGNDSGITHLAASLGVKTIVVFGPTNKDVYKPIGPNVAVFSGNEDFTNQPSAQLQQDIISILQTMIA